MATYREQIKKSLDKTESEFLDVDGTTIKTAPTFPVAFAYFTMHLAASYLLTADMLCGQNFPNVGIEDEWDEGDAIEDPLERYVELKSLLAGYGRSTMRRVVLLSQIHRFLEWLMDEEVPEWKSIDDPCWWSAETIVDKWNEFASIANSED